MMVPIVLLPIYIVLLTYLTQKRYLKTQKIAVSSVMTNMTYKQCEYDKNLLDNPYWIFYWDSTINRMTHVTNSNGQCQRNW